jgi:hypothetical protein
VNQKQYRLAGTELRRLLRKQRGGGIVTERISVDGCRVGYMERMKPAAPEDSGWLFAAGDEDDAYMGVPSNMAVFDLNCVANFDRDVVPLLDATVGSAFARGSPDAPLDRVQDGAAPRFPIVSGDYALTTRWSVTLPGEFYRRIEDDSLVLWRPAHTIWTLVWGLPPKCSRAEQVRHLIERCAPESKELEVRETGARHEISYRLDEVHEDSVVHALYGFVVTEQGYVQMAQYLDIVEDVALAREILCSLREESAGSGDCTAGSAPG